MSRKILVVSDSHGNWQKLQKIINDERPFHYLIHCGDGAGDLFHVDIPGGVKVVRVTGNVDRGRGYDMDRLVLLEIEGARIMVTHGDDFGVHNTLGNLISRAHQEGVTRVFFGHTHVKLLQEGSPVLFNPGPASNGSYGTVEIANGSWKYSHRNVKYG